MTALTNQNWSDPSQHSHGKKGKNRTVALSWVDGETVSSTEVSAAETGREGRV